MNRITLITVSIVVLGVLALGLYILFTTLTNQAPTGGAHSGTSTLPVSGSVSSTTLSAGSMPDNKLVVAARGTEAPIVVNNFLKNGVTVEDIENPGIYYLAGSVGYCLKDGTCPAGAAAENFIVAYDTSLQFFTISLTKEPLGTARADAEQFLIKTLGISQADLCNIKYFLSTTSSVNPFYAGTNLGFSFCPGATELPQ